MVNISLVELKSKVEQTKGRSSYSGNPYSMGFVTNFMATPEIKTSAKDVTRQVLDGKYGLKTKYVIYFLYNCLSDDDSRFFLEEKGGKLHEMSSGRITILTYFDDRMIGKWGSVQMKESIGYDENYNGEWDSWQLMQDLQEYYDIEDLPAIVIAKQESDGTESFCVKQMVECSKEVLFSTFKEIINIINQHYDQSFNTVVNRICGPTVKPKNYQGFTKSNTANFIDQVLRERIKNRKPRITRDSLVGEMGIDAKTLYNRSKEDNLERDWCFMIALKLGLSIDQLNELLDLNGYKPIAIFGREEIIGHCIINSCDIDETNELLKEKGLKLLSR